MQTNKIYEFGKFRLDAGERLLFDGTDAIALAPKVFDTLLLLVENSGHALGKEEMMERIWADSFVEENNLAQNVSILRKRSASGRAARNTSKPFPNAATVSSRRLKSSRMKSLIR